MESGKFVEIPWEMIDKIVIDELKQSFETNIYYKTNQPDDYRSELAESLKTVLKYYMTEYDFELYMEQIGESECELESDIDNDAA